MNDSDSEDEKAVEDEDSNDEGNYRNDYPDEDDSDHSIGEREMRRAMKSFDIDHDLSSDESDYNGFVYSVDADAFSFEDDLDYCDVDRYGEAYARYKKRVVRELEGGESDDSDESDKNNRQQDGSPDGSFHSD